MKRMYKYIALMFMLFFVLTTLSVYGISDISFILNHTGNDNIESHVLKTDEYDVAAVSVNKIKSDKFMMTAQKTADADKTSFDKSKFVNIPRFFDLFIEKAEERFTEIGLKCVTEYDYNVNKKGVVYSVKFHGYYDDNNFYIQPGSEVTLKVSLGRYSVSNAEADSEKTIYLTFDDGPTKYKTDRVLEILETYNIKATFFVVGQSAGYYKDQIKAIYDAGHVIGCHSFSHDYYEIYDSVDLFLDDIKLWEETVYGIIGEPEYKIYRFPGGSTQARGDYDTYCKILKSLSDKGYNFFDWTMSNNDVWAKKRAGNLSPYEYVKQCFLDQLNQREQTPKTPKILLVHETSDYTVSMMEWAIKLLLDRGYCFETLDKLTYNWTL